MRNRRSSLLVVLLFIVLLLVSMMTWEANRGVNANAEIAENYSWFDEIFGFADDEVGGGGASYGYSSFFGGFEFRFRIRDYRAMQDDDLSEADDMQ